MPLHISRRHRRHCGGRILIGSGQSGLSGDAGVVDSDSVRKISRPPVILIYFHLGKFREIVPIEWSWFV